MDGFPGPVTYYLLLSHPVMVTTRTQAKRDSNLVTDTEADTEGTLEERPVESDSFENTEDISATNTLNSEYSNPTKKVETV